MTRQPMAVALALACLGAVLPPAAQAAGNHGPTHAHGAAAAAPEQQPWGIAGERKSARRTVTVTMGDDMRFKPDRIRVREGDTVRFVLRNAGKLQHELVLGTPEALREHAALMDKHPGMEHDEPHMQHVAPGKSAELVWNFNRAGEFQYACLVPGHFQAGMVGTITVVPRTQEQAR